MSFLDNVLLLLEGLVSAASGPLDRMKERAQILGTRMKRRGVAPPTSVDVVQSAMTTLFPADAKAISDIGWGEVHNALMDAYLRS